MLCDKKSEKHKINICSAFTRLLLGLQKIPGLKIGIAPGASLNSLRLSFVKPVGT